MAKLPDEYIKKLAATAFDLAFPEKVRIEAISSLGDVGTYEALLVLLELAANDRLTRKERLHVLKQAHNIVKAGY